MRSNPTALLALINSSPDNPVTGIEGLHIAADHSISAQDCMMMNELFPGWGNWLRSEKASAQQKIAEWNRMKPIVKFIHDMVQRPDGPAAYWYSAVIEETFTNTGEDYLNKLCKTPREVELMALVTDDLLPYVYHTVHWDMVDQKKKAEFYHVVMRLHDAAVSSVS